MKVEFERAFTKDLKKLEDTIVARRVAELIDLLERSPSLSIIPDLKKLHGGDSHYRVRVNSYRLGIRIEDETIVLVRLLHRKDIYKRFP